MQSSIQFIRNATFIFNYGGKKFLVDPVFASKGLYPGFPGTPNSEMRNPLVSMPVNPESLLDVDAVLVSHLHPDHWDEVAINTIPKNMKVLTQNEEDAKIVEAQGFLNVEAIGENVSFDGLSFIKTNCQHGTDAAYSIPDLAAFLGKSSGYYFNTDGEQSIYFLGDTIWTDEVENNLINWQPNIVVINAGYASLADERLGAVITGKDDVEKIHKILPKATIIAIHMEALNHCLLSRDELQNFVNEKGFASKVIIPKDGEEIKL